MDVYRSQFRDDRLWWIGRGRGSYRIDRGGYRLQSGAGIQDGAKDVDVARGMWCRRSDRWYLQGTYRRVGVRDRGIDAGPYDDFRASFADLVSDGGYDVLYLYRHRGHV